MNVITSYPVIVDNKKQSPGEYYLNADAGLIKGKSQSIKNFQNWLDVNYPTWNVGKRMSMGAGYGTFNSVTEAAWGLYGDRYATEVLKVGDNLSTTDPSGKTQKGKLWDKVKKTWVDAKEAGLVDKGLDFLKGVFGGSSAQAQTGATDVTTTDTTITDKKGMSTTTKILIGGGVLVGVGLIIYFATRGSKSGK